MGENTPKEDKHVLEKSPENTCTVETEDGEDMASVVVEPLDGGWGWVIVFASFMCNVIVDGIIFSYGLFIPELAEAFGEPKGRLAWIGSIMAGFYLIAGPVVSGFANAYGCRPITIIGTVISAASFAVSSLAPNMEFLCVTFGLFGGIGFGFIYLPAVVTVGFYFEKRRALATGLAVCGSGVGTFVMAPFVKYLLETYAWKGTMLILAGVVLHCALFGALFKPLQPKAKQKDADDDDQKPLPLLQRIKEYRDAQKVNWESQEYLGTQEYLAGRRMSDTTGYISLNQVDRVTGTSEKYCDDSDVSPSDSNNSPPPSYSEVIGEDERLTFLAKTNAPKTPTPARSLPVIKPSASFCKVPKDKKRASLREEYLRPFYRQDILYSASVLNLPQFTAHPDVRHYRASITTIPPNIQDGSKNCCCSPVMKETFRQMLDLSLLRSPTFLVFGLGGFLTLAGFFVPFMFIIDRAVISGISPEEATYILPVIGLTNTVGRVFSGWVSDRPSLNALTINNIALIVGGLVTAFSPFLNSFGLLVAYGAIFGFAIACFATLRSIIVVELLGLEKLTNAFGLLLLFQGVATIIGAPVAGMFYDITGSYDASFYIAGSLILVSGILGIPLPYISRWEKRRKEKRSFSAAGIQIIVGDYETSADPQPEAV